MGIERGKDWQLVIHALSKGRVKAIDELPLLIAGPAAIRENFNRP